MSEKMREAYEGPFLEGGDIPEGDSFTLAISHVALPNTENDKGGKVIDKAILAFHKAKKRLILGKTNYKVICACLGSDEGEWVGKTLTLSRHYYPACFGSENVPCIRVIPPTGTPLMLGVIRHMGKATPYSSDEIKRGKRTK